MGVIQQDKAVLLPGGGYQPKGVFLFPGLKKFPQRSGKPLCVPRLSPNAKGAARAPPAQKLRRGAAHRQQHGHAQHRQRQLRHARQTPLQKYLFQPSVFLSASKPQLFHLPAPSFFLNFSVP
ncbi:hypothetical protein SDC9_105109 [bioreactor metagenome]|uniref:Uncharacterized protein n=1 Tax=bioreactor metagenome TaxID=1076179 RepID=A0A645AZR3_9ZZZZ